MQTIQVETWSKFKTLVASKKLSIQYGEDDARYDLFAPESQTIIWAVSILKGSDDAADFENTYKDTANAPLETKAGVGRPERVAPSPQPNDTTEKWKGFHVEMTAEETTKVIDIAFDSDVYLKGGLIYSDDCDCEDYVKADVVAKAAPTVIVKADVLKNVYLIKNMMIPFMSSECMFLPATVMLRFTYTKAEPLNVARCVSALADYFEANA